MYLVITKKSGAAMMSPALHDKGNRSDILTQPSIAIPLTTSKIYLLIIA